MPVTNINLKRPKEEDDADAALATAAAISTVTVPPPPTAMDGLNTTRANGMETLPATPSAIGQPPPAKKARKGHTGGGSLRTIPKIISTEPGAFNNYLFQLLLFKADRGSFHVLKEEYPELHAWLQHIKREYKNYAAQNGMDAEEPDLPGSETSLTADQVKVLQHLHVPLTSRGDEHWNRFFHLLQEYKASHGHVLVPRLCEVPGLGDWVTDQRRQHKAMKQGQSTQLTADRKAKLESLGFVWQVRNRPEWEHRYKELLEYKKTNGDCKVPQHYKENKALGKWVAKQREQYKLLKQGKHSFLTEDRLEKLNQVGFVWQVRSSLDPDIVEEVAAASAYKAQAEEAAAAIKKEEPTPVIPPAASHETGVPPTAVEPPGAIKEEPSTPSKPASEVADAIVKEAATNVAEEAEKSATAEEHVLTLEV